MITMQMQKIKKLVPIPKKQQIKKKIEYMGNVDDKLFKEYSNGKNFKFYKRI